MVPYILNSSQNCQLTRNLTAPFSQRYVLKVITSHILSDLHFKNTDAHGSLFLPLGFLLNMGWHSLPLLGKLEPQWLKFWLIRLTNQVPVYKADDDDVLLIVNQAWSFSYDSQKSKMKHHHFQSIPGWKETSVIIWFNLPWQKAV